EALFKLTEQVEQGVREPEEKLNISGVMLTDNGDDSLTLSILGEGFEPGSVVTINSATAIRFSGADIEFFSSERIDVTFDATELSTGTHDVTVDNPDGQSETLSPAFTWDGKTSYGTSSSPSSSSPPPRGGPGKGPRKPRTVMYSAGGRPLTS